MKIASNQPAAMLNLTPKTKRTVAREWLVLLALIVLSPVLVSFVHWTHEGTGILLPETSNVFERIENLPNDEDAYRTEDYIEHPERLKLVPSTDGKSYREIPPRSFADRTLPQTKHPATYLDVLYIYPDIHSLICSIIWAVKLLKRREAV